MTIIPNLLVTGILTVIASLALLVWAIFFVQRPKGWLVMILISIAMLLVGGGIFPPTFGILTAIVAARIHSPLNSQRIRLSAGSQEFLAKLWPWSLTVCILAWLSTFPVGYYFGAKDPQLMWTVLAFALGTIFFTIFSGIVVDAQGS